MSEFFRFCFVRNPWDKVISEVHCPHTQGAFPADAALEDKIEIVCELAESGLGGHFRHQLAFVDGDPSTMDVVGRFEHLARDFRRIARRLGRRRLRLAATGANRRPPYSLFYRSATRALVADTYQGDIEAFGYEFEDLT